MHEQICTEIKVCMKINKISILTENMQTKQNIIIKQKQSLIHKVPSGVTILMYVCGVETNIPLSFKYLEIQKYEGDKDSMSFISGKRERESPPSILVTRNSNWSQRSDTRSGCVKRRY